MRYEIYRAANGWKWRFVDGIDDPLTPLSRPLTREQCVRTVQRLRRTLSAPVVVVC